MSSTQQFVTLFEKDPNKAKGKEYLAHALKINDKDHDAWIEFAELFRKERKAKSAISCLKKAVEIDPTDAISWATMGKLAMAIKDAKSSVDYYSQAIKLDEMNVELLKSRRASFQLLGRPDLANEDAQTINELKKNAQGGHKAGAEMPDDEAYEDD